jgi:uncharacterized membrane protein
MIHEFIKVAGSMGEVVELIGVLIIVFGFIYAFFSTILLKRKKSEDRLGNFRTVIKKNMLLGLDFLVAGDIIRTVTVDPSLSGVASLGFLVLIRTTLVFTIHLEIEGHWPWQTKPEKQNHNLD